MGLEGSENKVKKDCVCLILKQATVYLFITPFVELESRWRLIHGLTASSVFFQKQIPSFSKHFQVIAVDLRGHGKSETLDDHLTLAYLAADLKQLLEHLHLPGVSLVGWSMGAHVIFEYIKSCGCASLDKIVIIDMAPKLMKSNDWSCGLPGIFSRRPGDFGHEDNLYLLSVMLNDWEAYSKIVARRILSRSLFNEKMEFNADADFKGKDDLPWLDRETKKNKAWIIAAFWISMAMQDYRPMLGDITVPCLMTYGAESNYYPPENYSYMSGLIPLARIVEFKGCGHALHIQDPDVFNTIVMQFLEE